MTPFNLDSVERRAEEFLDDPQAESLKMFVVANWKFSVGVGGFFSLLTVAYVFSLIFGTGLKTVHLVQKACGVPPKRWLWVKQLSK